MSSTSTTTIPASTTTLPVTTTTGTTSACSGVSATVTYQNVVISNPPAVIGPGLGPGGQPLPATVTDTQTHLSGTIVNDSSGSISNVTVDVNIDYANGTHIGLPVPLNFGNGPQDGYLSAKTTNNWTGGTDNDDAATSATMSAVSYQSSLPPFSCEWVPG